MTPSELALFEKLRRLLNLTHIDASTVTAETPLFGGGLELDSIDVLEISTMIQKEYGVMINAAERGQEVFGSLGKLAAFLDANRNRDKAG